MDDNNTNIAYHLHDTDIINISALQSESLVAVLTEALKQLRAVVNGKPYAIAKARRFLERVENGHNLD